MPPAPGDLPSTSDTTTVDLDEPRTVRILWLAAALVVIAHLVGLTVAPPGLYVDEASYGYNAYSILRSGADDAGVHMPLFFRAFGEYKNPVFIYALVPLVALLGLSVETVRLGSALFALLTALGVALVVRRMTGGLGRPLLGFVAAGLTPWLFVPGRVATEAIVLPCALAFAWWAWSHGLASRRLVWFAASGLALSLAFYSYAPGRLIAPVLAVALVATSWRALERTWWRVAGAALPLALAIGAAAAWSLANPGALTGRFEMLSVFSGEGGVAGGVGRAAGRYASYFGPHFLLTHGDPILRHNSGFGGELLVTTLPVLLAGLVRTWRERRRPEMGFALAGFLLFPLAASLTTDADHAMRTIGGAPFAVVLAVLGVDELASWLRRPRAILLGLATIASLEGAIFLADYFSAYPARASAFFNAGQERAAEVALGARRGPLYFAPSAFRDENARINQPGYVFLFAGRLDPATYQRLGLAGFDILPFEPGVVMPAGSVVLVKSAEELLSASRKPVAVSNPDVPAGAKVLARIPATVPARPDSPEYRVLLLP